MNSFNNFEFIITLTIHAVALTIVKQIANCTSRLLYDLTGATVL